MNTLPQRLPPDNPHAVTLYAWVSTEDEAERQTVQGQLDFLRYGLVIADEHVDDGWSGAVPLSARPEGRRLQASSQRCWCTGWTGSAAPSLH